MMGQKGTHINFAGRRRAGERALPCTDRSAGQARVAHKLPSAGPASSIKRFLHVKNLRIDMSIPKNRPTRKVRAGRFSRTTNDGGRFFRPKSRRSCILMAKRRFLPAGQADAALMRFPRLIPLIGAFQQVVHGHAEVVRDAGVECFSMWYAACSRVFHTKRKCLGTSFLYFRRRPSLQDVQNVI